MSESRSVELPDISQVENFLTGGFETTEEDVRRELGRLFERNPNHEEYRDKILAGNTEGIDQDFNGVVPTSDPAIYSNPEYLADLASLHERVSSLEHEFDPFAASVRTGEKEFVAEVRFDPSLNITQPWLRRDLFDHDSLKAVYLQKPTENGIDSWDSYESVFRSEDCRTTHELAYFSGKDQTSPALQEAKNAREEVIEIADINSELIYESGDAVLLSKVCRDLAEDYVTIDTTGIDLLLLKPPEGDELSEEAKALYNAFAEQF